MCRRWIFKKRQTRQMKRMGTLMRHPRQRKFAEYCMWHHGTFKSLPRKPRASVRFCSHSALWNSTEVCLESVLALIKTLKNVKLYLRFIICSVWHSFSVLNVRQCNITVLFHCWMKKNRDVTMHWLKIDTNLWHFTLVELKNKCHWSYHETTHSTAVGGSMRPKTLVATLY